MRLAKSPGRIGPRTRTYVRAEGKVIHAGRQIAVADGQIVGPDGKIYAHATTTCLIFDHAARG